MQTDKAWMLESMNMIKINPKQPRVERWISQNKRKDVKGLDVQPVKFRNRWRLMEGLEVIIRYYKTRRLSSDGATEHKSRGTSAPKERVSIHPNDLKWSDIPPPMNLQQLGICRCNGRDEILSLWMVVSLNRSMWTAILSSPIANGKSAVRVAAKEVWFFHLSRRQIVYWVYSQVRPAGPHLWRDGLNQDLQSVHMDQDFCLKFCYLFVTSAKKPRKLVHGVVDISSLCFPLSESSKLDVLLLWCAWYLFSWRSLSDLPIMVVHYESCPFLQMAGHKDGGNMTTYCKDVPSLF